MAKSKQDRSRPLVEWIFGGVSTVAVAGLLLYLAVMSLSGPGAPPDLVARLDRVEKLSGGWLASATIENRGDATAAQVQLHAILKPAQGKAEQREIVFDYVPAHSRRQGAFLFQAEPQAAGDIRFVVQGYSEP